MRIKGMPLSIKGKPVKRPDLLSFKSNETFAIEVKGYSGSAGNMDDHKEQSKTGGIPVNFTVASVSYNLYKKVKCNYFDPRNENIPFDNKVFKDLTKEYYSGFLEFLEYGRYEEIKYQNESFYETDLFYPPYWDKNFYPKYPFRHFWEELFHFYRLRLILPNSIKEFAQNGLTENIKPFLFDGNNDNVKEGDIKTYIDNDRIGLKIENNGW